MSIFCFQVNGLQATGRRSGPVGVLGRWDLTKDLYRGMFMDLSS
jgi:hypothetical protein